jgi:hypothetical protein
MKNPAGCTDAAGRENNNSLSLPPEIIKDFEREAAGLQHGSVTLTAFFRDGHVRYELTKVRSFIPEGGCH